MQVLVVGMAWFSAESYDRLRALFEDGDKLPVTYAQWLVNADAGYQSLSASGVSVIKVDIDLDQFPKWCASQGHNINAEARKAYASFVAYRTLASTA